MSPARWVARHLWFGMLWFMRRPWLKRARRGAPGLLPERMRTKAWQNIVRQDRWARRYGVAILTVTVNVFFLSVAATAAFYAVLWLGTNGYLSGGEYLRDRSP